MCPSGRPSDMRKATRSAFDVLDADHDGRISRDDLRIFYKGFSRAASPDHDETAIRSMIAVADSNNNGFVEYDEFERVLGGEIGGGVGNKRRISDNGIMEDVFKVMDKDGDGKLSHGDLKSYMQWAGFDASDDDIKAMIKLAAAGDDDKDGVYFDDLLKILAVDSYICKS